MTAPQPAAAPSRFQADLVTVALVIVVFLALAMAFVFTEQDKAIPTWLEGIIIGALPALGFYRASSPGQTQAVQLLAGQVEQLGTAVDLNHLDTMSAVADLAPTDPPRAPIPEPAGDPIMGMRVTRLDDSAAPAVHPNQTNAVAMGLDGKPIDLPPMAPSDRPAEPEPDALLEELHEAAAAAAPAAPAPSVNAPPVAS